MAMGDVLEMLNSVPFAEKILAIKKEEKIKN